MAGGSETRLVMRDPGWTFNQRNGIAYPPGMNPDEDDDGEDCKPLPQPPRAGVPVGCTAKLTKVCQGNRC